MQRSTNRKRTLIVSGAIILLAMTIIVGTTFALFTDTQRVTNHLQAGTLEVTLKRVGLTKNTLTKEGYLKETVFQTPGVDKPHDFTNPVDSNVFGIGANELIVPGSKFVADMEIHNLSDVAFGYWIEIVCTDKAKGEDIAKQLKVTVTTDDGKTYHSSVENGLAVKGENGGAYIESLIVGSKDKYVEGSVGKFTVTVEFLDSFVKDADLGTIEHNNLAKNEQIDFDLRVHAVQLTEAP